MNEVQNKKRPPYVTEEYIIEHRRLREEKKRKRLEERPVHSVEENAFDCSFVKRPMVSLRSPSSTNSLTYSIMTYNVLAQSLIRRSLFPTNGEAVKWKNRSTVLANEIAYYSPDVLCCQEVDYEKLNDFWKPFLERMGYQFEYQRGRKKVHGLVIAWNRELFTLKGLERVDFDCEDSGWPRPLRKTGNIGLIVGLESKKRTSLGVVIGTCHLFWHPESGIMSIEAARVSNNMGWPCILAGDFNSTTDDCAYPALTLRPISMATHTQELAEKGLRLDRSSIHADEVEIVTEVGVDEEADSRLQNDSEMKPLCSVADLVNFHHRQPKRWNSCYGHSYLKVDPENIDKTYKEPWFSNWASKWEGLLDYIFVLDQGEGVEGEMITRNVNVLGLLRMPRKCEMGKGEPREGRYPSDHLALMVKLEFTCPQ